MKKRYITNAVHETVPIWLQQLIWYLWDGMETSKKSHLQTFLLSGSDGKQRIEHAQEQPPYRQMVETAVDEAPVCGKVLLIEESDRTTMLFVSERTN